MRNLEIVDEPKRKRLHFRVPNQRGYEKGKPDDNDNAARDQSKLLQGFQLQCAL
jgi:hypothetical protein